MFSSGLLATMKMLVPILLLAVFVNAASGVALLPPASGTNDLAELRMAANVNVAVQNYAFINGKIERLERETDRLEVGFVLLSILAGSAISALCALAFRDAGLKRQRTAGKLPAESPSERVAVPERA